MKEDRDYHEMMIQAFQEYFKYHNKLLADCNVTAGVKARFWLGKIKEAATLGKREILKTNKEIKKSRNGKPGRPKRIIKDK